jgi:hypothetical protein
MQRDAECGPPGNHRVITEPDALVRLFMIAVQRPYDRRARARLRKEYVEPASVVALRCLASSLATSTIGRE